MSPLIPIMVIGKKLYSKEVLNNIGKPKHPSPCTNARPLEPTSLSGHARIPSWARPVCDKIHRTRFGREDRYHKQRSSNPSLQTIDWGATIPSILSASSIQFPGKRDKITYSNNRTTPGSSRIRCLLDDILPGEQPMPPTETPYMIKRLEIQDGSLGVLDNELTHTNLRCPGIDVGQEFAVG